MDLTFYIFYMMTNMEQYKMAYYLETIDID